MALSAMVSVAATEPEVAVVLVRSAAGGGTETDPQAGSIHTLTPMTAAAMAPARMMRVVGIRLLI